MSDARRFVGVRLAPAGYDYVAHVAARDNVTFSEALRRLLSVGATTDWETHANGRQQSHSPRHGVTAGDVRAHEHADRHLNGDGCSDRVPDLPQPPNPGDDDDPRYARIPRDSATYPTSGSDHPATFTASDIDRIDQYARSRYPHLYSDPGVS